MGVERGRKLDRAAGVAHALEAAVGRRVGAPAGHPGDVELTVLGIEPPAVHAREELAGQGNDRTLRLAVDLLAQDEEVRPRAEREVEHLALRAGRTGRPGRSPGRRSNCRARAAGRPAAGRGPAVLRAAVAVMAAGPDLADHRRGRPFSFGVGDGDRAVGRQAQAVGIAEAGRQRSRPTGRRRRSAAAPACPRPCRSGRPRRARGRR